MTKKKHEIIPLSGNDLIHLVRFAIFYTYKEPLLIDSSNRDNHLEHRNIFVSIHEITQSDFQQ